MGNWNRHAPRPGQQEDRTEGIWERELAARSIEVAAGAGAVLVRVDGRGRVRHLTIDPAAFEGRDHELLADLILGATAEAQRRAAELAAGDDSPGYGGPSGGR